MDFRASVFSQGYLKAFVTSFLLLRRAGSSNGDSPACANDGGPSCHSHCHQDHRAHHHNASHRIQDNTEASGSATGHSVQRRRGDVRQIDPIQSGGDNNQTKTRYSGFCFMVCVVGLYSTSCIKEYLLGSIRGPVLFP